MKLNLLSWCKDRAKLNIVIDTFMLVFMMATAGLGFLIKYVLLPGFKRNEVYGSNVELTFLNMDRHQWGTIHLIISLVLVALVIVHILLHWKMIVCIYKKLLPGKKVRNIFGISILLVSAFLSIVPFFIEPKQEFDQPNYRNRRSIENQRLGSAYIRQVPSNPQENNTKEPEVSTPSSEGDKINPFKGEHGKSSKLKSGNTASDRRYAREGHNEYDVEVYGSMTLKEVSRKYDVNLKELSEQLNVPVDQTGYRLGRLRRRYGFHMNDIRAVVTDMMNAKGN